MPIVHSLLMFQYISVSVFFSPSASVVEICAGGNFTLTCVTDTGILVWHRVGGLTKTFSSVTHNKPSPLGDHITVYPISSFGSVITSVANIKRAPLALNGTVIQCRDHGDDGSVNNEKTLLVAGKINFIVRIRMCL